MVAYKARCGWGSTPQPGDPTVEAVTSLRLSLILTCFDKSPDQVWLDDVSVDHWSAQLASPASIFWRDGSVFVAVHPLNVFDHGREHGVALRQSNGFCLIDLFNYQGPPRTFTAHELLTTHNGYAIEVASADDFESFAAFRAFHGSPVVTDVYDPADAMRILRYEREGLSLGMELSPVSDGVKCRTINDRLAPERFFHAGTSSQSL